MTTIKTADTQRASGSSLGGGQLPRRRWPVIMASVLAGFLLTVLWSAEFVDQAIGGSITDGLLGDGAREAPIAGVAAGLVFAFVTGLAGTFTACNIAVFGTLAPMLGAGDSRWRRLGRALRPLAWLSAGALAVSLVYGAIVGLAGTHMPQYSTASAVPGLSARSVQSMVVFGAIGVVMIYLGLATLGVVPDLLARLARRHPNAPMVVMGVLVGGFLIGRPYPLFRHLFRDAADSGNPLYGAVAFGAQSIGNLVITAAIFLILMFVVGGRIQRWLAADPRRLTVLTATSLLVAGVFTLLYWTVRLLARRDVIPWYPIVEWF